MRRFVPVVLLLAAGANAEVTNSAVGGFELEHEVEVPVSRPVAWEAAVAAVGAWWSSAHTVSGDAANLSIDARPMGCFCETVGTGGAVVHLTVTFVNPAVMLRMTGGLGPLGLMGVNGNMTWEFFETEGGTRIRFTYAVGGYHPHGLDSIAPAVDLVVGDALQRLAAYVLAGDPDAG